MSLLWVCPGPVLAAITPRAWLLRVQPQKGLPNLVDHKDCSVTAHSNVPQVPKQKLQRELQHTAALSRSLSINTKVQGTSGCLVQQTDRVP